MAIQLLQDGYPYLPEPNKEQYPDLTDDAQLRKYLSDLVKALREYVSVVKTDSDNINAAL